MEVPTKLEFDARVGRALVIRYEQGSSWQESSVPRPALLTDVELQEIVRRYNAFAALLAAAEKALAAMSPGGGIPAMDLENAINVASSARGEIILTRGTDVSPFEYESIDSSAARAGAIHVQAILNGSNKEITLTGNEWAGIGAHGKGGAVDGDKFFMEGAGDMVAGFPVNHGAGMKWPPGCWLLRFYQHGCRIEIMDQTTFKASFRRVGAAP